MEDVARQEAKTPLPRIHAKSTEKEWSQAIIDGLKGKPRAQVIFTEGKPDSFFSYACDQLYLYLTNSKNQDNTMEYHKCCIVFTTRWSECAKDHHREDTMTLCHFFKKERIKSSTTFLRFMESEVRKFPPGQQFVPGLNLFHDQDMQREDGSYARLE